MNQNKLNPIAISTYLHPSNQQFYISIQNFFRNYHSQHQEQLACYFIVETEMLTYTEKKNLGLHFEFANLEERGAAEPLMK